jgi:hypothetical protein
MYVNIQQATKLTGKSRATITRHIKSGKLSKTDDGIETSELIRVYGALIAPDDVSLSQSTDESMATREQWLMSHIDALQRQLIDQKVEYVEREKKLFAMLTHQAPEQKEQVTQPEPRQQEASLLWLKLFGRH